MFKKNGQVRFSKNWVLGLVSIFSFLPIVAISQTVLPVLEPNKPIERELAAGESHSYNVRLEANQYARVTAKQAGTSILIKVFDLDGRQKTQTKSYVDAGKTERAFIVTNSAGNHRVEVTATEAQKTGGKYMIILEEIRAATEKDQFLMKAMETLSEAERLHSQGNAAAFREALTKYDEALPLWQKSGDTRGLADTLHYQAIVFFSLGETQKALENLNQARELYKETQIFLEEATVLRGIGLIYHTLGELSKALEFYEQGLEINRRLKNQYGEANDLGNIGGIYQYLGEYQKAIEYYRNALELTRKFQNNTNEARLLNNIGEVYRLLGENQNALYYLEEAIKLRRAIKDRRGEGNTLNNTALVYAALGDYTKALELFNLSVAIRQEIGDVRGASTTINNIGFAYFKTGEYQKALEFLQKGLELKRKSGNRRSEAASLYLLGAVHSNLNEKEKALDYFQQALSHSREVRDHETEAASLKAISEIERERGNFSESLKLMEEAIKVVESLRSSIAIQNLRTSFLASKQDYYDAYIDLLMHLHKQQPSKGFDAQAFQVSEKARARSLIDALSESRLRIRQGVDPALLELERTIQKQINGKENLRERLADRKGAEKQLEAVEKELNNLLEQYNEVQAQIRLKSPAYADLTEPSTLDFKAIQKLLDSETLLLEYSLGEKRSFVWAVTSNSLESFELPKEKDIEILARKVYELLISRNRAIENETPAQIDARLEKADKDLQIGLQNLSEMILKPISSQQNKKRLVIVAENALQYVPFGALPIPAAKIAGNKKLTAENYQPLIVEREIINLPSASTLAVLRQKSAERNEALDSVAAIADPVFSKDDPRVAQSIARLKDRQQTSNDELNAKSNGIALVDLKRSAEDLGVNEFKRLRFSRQEADLIALLVPKTKSIKAVDFAADKDLLIKKDLSKYQILHFATHGLLNDKNPELSGIVFSLVDERGNPKDGFLRLHEIYNMQIGADLVVLSACQTALGKDIKGEGLIGLTRGFMYAGAQSIVASLWKVEDRATAQLMKKFYRALLRDKQTPAAALRTAQIEMWHDLQWNNPYYWAAFTLQGEWK